MRYLTIVLIVLSLLLCFPGCQSPQDNGPAFYYLNAESGYGSSGSIIGSENRSSADVDGNLRYMLALYLNGPIDDGLRSPFPNGTAIVSLESSGDTLYLTMSSPFAKLSGTELTKACACIALTVFGNTDAQSVVIHAKDAESGTTRTMELSRDSLVLQDSLSPNH